MANMKPLLLQIGAILHSKYFTKDEIITKLDEIGTLITKRANSIKKGVDKQIAQDDIPKSSKDDFTYCYVQ